MQQEVLVSAPARRFNLDKIIRSRDRREICPRCWAKMRYRRVEGRMTKWAPGLYAWFCPSCPVTLLDGSIVPGDQTWDTRMKDDDDKRIASFLSFAIRGEKDGKKK